MAFWAVFLVKSVCFSMHSNSFYCKIFSLPPWPRHAATCIGTVPPAPRASCRGSSQWCSPGSECPDIPSSYTKQYRKSSETLMNICTWSSIMCPVWVSLVTLVLFLSRGKTKEMIMLRFSTLLIADTVLISLWILASFLTNNCEISFKMIPHLKEAMSFIDNPMIKLIRTMDIIIMKRRKTILMTRVLFPVSTRLA